MFSAFEITNSSNLIITLVKNVLTKNKTNYSFFNTLTILKAAKKFRKKWKTKTAKVKAGKITIFVTQNIDNLL